MLFTIVVSDSRIAALFLPSCQVSTQYPRRDHTPIYGELYLLPTTLVCAEERVSPAHESDSSSSSTACKMAATAAAAGVVAGIAAAAVGCCSCCCADPAPRPAAAQQQQLYVRHRRRQQLAVYAQITGRTGRVLYAHYRTKS